jgi:hypothetical protein
MNALIVAAWCVLASGTTQAAEAANVDGIRAVYRNGQTFVTWKDVAEGREGARFRYSLYRSGRPFTPDSLDRAELCYSGVLNNSAKLYVYAFRQADRLNPDKPTCVIEEGGAPLPMWSGLAVRTVAQAGRSYYAVLATDTAGRRLGAILPGRNATAEPVEEHVAPIQPIKIGDSKARNPASAMTGTKGLSLTYSLHGSSSTGGDAGSTGDLYLYFGTPDMGWRDGLPGLFSVTERPPKQGLVLFPRDAIVNPSGNGVVETCWFGYFCVPQGAKHTEPRVYPFTERRMMWMLQWTMKKYEVDPLRVYSVGQSMGGMASTQLSFRRPEVFAAVYPRLQRVRQSWLPALLPGITSINKGRYNQPTPMEDGVTDYFDHMDSVKWVKEQHGDLPFYGWCCGRNDWVEPWGAYIEMVKALTANHHGFAMAWTDGGHDNETPRVMVRVNKYYGPEKFARNQSYPAFGTSSIDDDLGSGVRVEKEVGGKKTMVLKDGALTGGVNLGFIWSDVVDEPDRWSVKLANDLATDDMAVDVTPRRCQKFKPKPGAAFSWTNSAGGAGQVAADQWGLVTIPKVLIKPGATTVLTLFAR